MNLFEIFSKYFWAICIVFAFINYLSMNAWMDDRDRMVDQALRRKYLARFWILNSVPWAVMGIGQMAGGVPSVWALFRPQDGNPWIWAFYAAGIGVYLVMVWWVFFADGARIAAELRLMKFHTPGRQGAVNAFWIKVMAIAGLPFMIFVIWMMSHAKAPLPTFP